MADPRILDTAIDGLRGPAGALEALLSEPEDAQGAGAVAVVCHPHPLHQGTMNNKVVHMLVRTFAQSGIPALRFNFRGVGTSAGAYDEGEGETDDALAAADWLTGRHQGAALWLAGFSFGGYVALRAAGARPCRGLVTVAPAVQRRGFAALVAPPCPWLVVHGDVDEVVPVDEVLAWVNGLYPGPELSVIAGASHFFHGKLTGLRESVAAFVREVEGA